MRSAWTTTAAHWIREHRLLSRTAKAALLWFALVMAGASAAAADEGTPLGTIIGLPAGITDSHGIPLEKYLTLPINRGDVWSWQSATVGSALDFIWAGHIFYVAWLLALIRLLLAFEWVDWLAVPLNGFATSLQALMNETGLVPLAMAVAGLVGGIMMMRGQIGRGILEWAVAGAIAVFVTGVLANPVATITGPNGALATMKAWGGELAVSITTDPTCSVTPDLAAAQGTQAPGCPDEETPAADVLTTTVLAQITDAFVRQPAITLTFGSLKADCQSVYDTQLRERNPLDTAEKTMREKVGECDKQAKAFVESPFPTKLAIAGIISSGAAALNLIALAFTVLAVGSLLSSLWNALKTPVLGLIALVPGTVRAPFWRAVINTWLAQGILILSVVLLACWMKLVSAVSALAAPLGITVQMGVVDILVLVLIVFIVQLRRKAKAAGETLAQKLASIGSSRPEPVRASALAPLRDRIEPWLRDEFDRRRRNPRRTPSQAAPLEDLGERSTAPQAVQSAAALGSHARLALTARRGDSPGSPSGPTPPAPTGGGGPGTKRTPGRVGKALDLAAAIGSKVPHPGVQAAARGVALARTATAAAGALNGGGTASGPGQGTAAGGGRIRRGPDGRALISAPLEGRIIEPPAPAAPSRASRTARAAALAAELASKTPLKPVGPVTRA